MKDLQENIISSVNQNKLHVYMYGNTGFKVLFVGNSITKHSPRPQAGWNNDCGMAASSPDKDYVHLLIEKFRTEYRSDTSFCIAQVADFEREFDKGNLSESIEKGYSLAKEYMPDIIIMFFGANVSKEYEKTQEHKIKFGAAYEQLRNYLVNDHSIVFHSQGFYIRPVLDAEKEEVARKYGDTFINIENIRNREETHGLFNHPGDLGMQEIADTFWKAIKQHLK